MKSLIALLLVFLTAGSILSQSWISSTNPTKYQRNVNKNTSLQVNFNRQISQATINSLNIKLYGTLQGYFPVTFSYITSQKKLTVSHEKPFMPGENIYLIITGNLRDSANNTMARIYSTMFTVQAPKGSGVFAQITSSIPTGAGPYYGACGDFNKDGKPDIAITNYNSYNISVMKNNGGLTFVSQLIQGYNNQAGIVSCDADCDGDLDLITTVESQNGVAVYLNNGSGIFTAMHYFITGTHPTAIATGFIDADGFPDIITASWDTYNPDIRIFKGTGNGTFVLKNIYTTGIRPLCIYIGDIDNDGDNDVGVGIDYSNPRIEFYLNDGNGNLSYSFSAGTLDRPYGIAGNDFDGDGFVDLAVSNKYMNSLSILIYSGNGIYINYIYPTQGSYPYGVTLNDFNKDGWIDIATALMNSNMIDVKLNTGNQMFFTTNSYMNLFGTSTNILSSDFDNDGDIDIAAINNASNCVSIYRNTDSSSVAVNPIESTIPSEYRLYQNYPNPFNPSTTIRFDIPQSVRSEYTTVRIYNSIGMEIAVLFEGYPNPGKYETIWDASLFTSGIYYCKIQSGRYNESRKMLLVK